MSVYRSLFKNDTNKTVCYLWKINALGEVVVEHVDESIPGLVSTSRGMCCLGNTKEREFYEHLNLAAEEVSDWRFASPPGLWAYNVTSDKQLVERLNAKGTNQAKIIWRAMPGSLLPRNVKYDETSGKWVIVKRDA